MDGGKGRGPTEGYLVVADIAGYTKFFTGTELEHAQGILEELTTLILDQLAPPLRFVKLEGDAVFCYAESSKFADAEHLVELLEVCYCEFSDRLFDMARSATCPCVACASIDTLDLKFVSHYGTFIVQHVGGVEDVAGPDVILVHRLLKNTITERTGCRAYVFFTDACLQRLPTSLALPAHAESYDDLGETSGGVHDLKPVLHEMREARREYVDSDSADFEQSGEVPLPPAVLWPYFVDPEKRLKWQTNNTAIKESPNERGRTGRGAYEHCTQQSGEDYVHRYVDWRPFSYFTQEVTPAKPSLTSFPATTATVEFIPSGDGGTLTSYRVRVHRRGLRARLVALVLAPLLRKMFESHPARLAQLLQEDGWIESSAEGADVPGRWLRQRSLRRHLSKV